MKMDLIFDFCTPSDKEVMLVQDDNKVTINSTCRSLIEAIRDEGQGHPDCHLDRD